MLHKSVLLLNLSKTDTVALLAWKILMRNKQSMDMKNLRVCHVVNTLSPGKVAFDLSETMLLNTELKNATVASIEKNPDFDYTGPAKTVCVNGNIKRLSQVISNHDIIHTYNTRSGALAKLLGTLHQKPIISREGNDHTKFSPKVRFLRESTNLLATKIVCISETVYSSFSKWNKLVLNSDNIEIVNTGIDIQRLTEVCDDKWSIYNHESISKSDIVIGNAASLTEQKDQKTAIEAVARLDDKIEQNVHLVIAGDGEKRSELVECSKQKNIDEKVHFLGYIDRSRVFKLYDEIDVFIMPSRWEGLCMALLQAMAFKNPCVISNIPVFREVHSSEVARFHNVGDPHSLSQELISIIQSPIQREEFGQRAYEHIVANFDIDSMVNRYTELYLNAFHSSQS